MGLLFSSIAEWTQCARLQFISGNIAVSLLYLFQDSLVREYYIDNKLYLNILFHSIQAISIIAYFCVSLKDPGIIKPFIDIDEEDLNFNIPSEAEQNNDNFLIGPNEVKPPTPLKANTNNITCKYIEVFSNDNNDYEFMVLETIPDYNRKIIIDTERFETWPSNYCASCDFIRPIRSKHCRMCNFCCGRYDHHCPLVSNCVGAYNYKYFFFFLLFESIFVVWILYICINMLLHTDSQNINNIKLYSHTIFGWIFRIALFIASFVLSFEIVGLLFFHFYLIFTGQTTMEFMRPGVVDKYLRQEAKRKQLFEKKQIKYYQNVKDEKDDFNNDMDQLHVAISKYKYQYHGNEINSYKTYFDYGCVKNIIVVFCGGVKEEWLTPIKCYFTKFKGVI